MPQIGFTGESKRAYLVVVWDARPTRRALRAVRRASTLISNLVVGVDGIRPHDFVNSTWPCGCANALCGLPVCAGAYPCDTHSVLRALALAGVPYKWAVLPAPSGCFCEPGYDVDVRWYNGNMRETAPPRRGGVIHTGPVSYCPIHGGMRGPALPRHRIRRLLGYRRRHENRYAGCVAGTCEHERHRTNTDDIADAPAL